MTKLQMSVEQGGLAVPNIRFSQLAAQLRYIAEWINNDPESVWLDLESVGGNALSSLLFAMDSKKSRNAGNKNILITTSLQAWQAIIKLEGRSKILSSQASIYGNMDFAPACSDMGLRIWEAKGILTLGELFDKGVMLTFKQIQQKYGLPSNHFFRYLQIRSFIKNQSRYDFDCQTSQMERLLLGRGKKAVPGMLSATLLAI